MANDSTVRGTGVAKQLKNQAGLLIMLIPAMVYYIIFHYLPLWGVQIAFRNYKVSQGIVGSDWVGLENFAYLLTRPQFMQVFGNTLIISFWKFILGFPLPILFALLLNEIQRPAFKRTVQTISYLPHFLSWVVLAGIFRQTLSPTAGPVAALFKSLGKEPIFWLGDTRYFRSVLVVTSMWKGFGWGSIVYLAAISGVDQEQYEAATIDGANRFQRMTHITIPGILPTVTIMFIFATGSLIADDFDQIYNMINSAVQSVADVLSTYTYRTGIDQGKYSRAAAAGLFQNLISFLLVILTNTITKRVNEYGIW